MRNAFKGLALVILLSLAAVTHGSDAAMNEIPYPDALNAAAIIQTPMAAEIPGAMILGNGDLNGILWVHQGRLRFSITKNDACDARLDTANDPDFFRVDIRNHEWNSIGFPPSWNKPYPTPMLPGLKRRRTLPSASPVMRSRSSGRSA